MHTWTNLMNARETNSKNNISGTKIIKKNKKIQHDAPSPCKIWNAMWKTGSSTIDQKRSPGSRLHTSYNKKLQKKSNKVKEEVQV